MARNDKYRGFVNLGASIKKSLGFLKKHNYHPALLILNKNWLEVIGERYYKYCKPERVYFRKNQKGNGILYVVVYNPVLAMYIESNKNFILDKVNRFFGYKAIADIKIKQTPKIVEEYCKKKKAKALDKKEKDKIISKIDKNTNDDLKKELMDFGLALASYKK
jgi:hypothetical protein